jgi:hypothetical protein
VDVPLTTKSSATCSTYVLIGTPEGYVADAVPLVSGPQHVVAKNKEDDPHELITDVGGVSLFLEIFVEPAKVVSSEPPLMELDADQVLTHVGGSSLFLELVMEATEHVVWDEQLADYVLTHIAGLSLFRELDVDTFPVPAFSKIPSWRRGGFSPWSKTACCGGLTNDNCSFNGQRYHVNAGGIEDAIRSFAAWCTCQSLLAFTHAPSAQLVLPRQNTSFFHVEQLLACRLHSSWDPGGSWFACLVLNSKLAAGHTTSYSMHNLLTDSIVCEDSKSVVLSIELCVQWDPGIMKILPIHAVVRERPHSVFGLEPCANISTDNHSLDGIIFCQASGQRIIFCLPRMRDMSESFLFPPFVGIIQTEQVAERRHRKCTEESKILEDIKVKLRMLPEDLFNMRFRTQFLASDDLHTENQLISQNWGILDSTTSQTWFCFILATKLQFKKWDPGVLGIFVAEVTNLGTARTRVACRLSMLLFICSISGCHGEEEVLAQELHAWCPWSGHSWTVHTCSCRGILVVSAIAA